MNLYLKTKIYYFCKAYLYIKPYKKLGFFIIIFSIASSIFDGIGISAIIPFFQNLINSNNQETVFPILTSIQNIFLQGSQENILIKLLVFALIMIIFKSIFNYFRVITIQKISNLIRRDLQNNIFSAIADSSLAFHASVRSGDFVSATSIYTNNIVNFIFIIFNLILRASRILIYGFVLLLISWKITLITLAFEIISFPFIRSMFIKIKNISLEITRELANLYSRMIEIISNVPLIKISGTEHYEKERFRKITTNLAILEYQQTKFQSLVPMLTETLVMLAIIISFLISVKTFKINVLTYLPFIVAYLYVFLRVFNEINAFLESISGMFQNVEPFKAYETKLNEAKKSKIKNGSVKFRSLLHEIKFQNVSFSYENEKTTLHHLNFSIPKGSFTAIIGQTGSGKTTIAKLLSGLFYPQEGEIIIDETNLKDLDLKNWLEKIGFISQDVMIFNDSIKNNLIYGYFNATQKNIDSAAKIADIYNFIKNLPNGYDTNIGERGSKLSGGQKQRLAIARAVIKNPEILILDEATSSLDSKTEKTIQSALEKVSAGRTVIAIAHRLSTIIKADNIIVLEKGQIVEQGTPTNLLCQNGYYKKYYDLQFKN